MWFRLENQKNKRKVVLFFTLGIVTLACSTFFPSTQPTPQPTLDVGLIYTQALETAQAENSIRLTQTAVSLPTQTPLPTATPTITPTNTPYWNGVGNSLCVPMNDAEIARVVDVIDGDTIKVLMDDKVYSVRYIGIDTPETNGEFYSSEATSKNTDLVFGKEVILVKDVSETDVYGRLLRYVISDNVFVNYELVLNGFARSSSYPPDSSCDTAFASAEQTARASVLGIWQPPTQSPIIYNTPASSSGSGNCSPSYPSVCIPPSPPDLDCGDITYRRFQVLPPDPHRFDRDGDGIGCEG